MIQKMKKLTFVIFRNDYEQFLASLQQLGVVHVQAAVDQSKAVPPTIQALRTQYAEADRILQALAAKAKANPDAIVAEGTPEEARKVVARYAEIKERQAVIKNTLPKAKNDYENLRPWGHIDEKSMQRLTDAGVSVWYYHVTVSEFDRNMEKYHETEVSRDKKFVYFLAFSVDGKEPEEVSSKALPMTLPAMTLDEALAAYEALVKEQQDLAAEEKSMSKALPVLKAYENAILDEIALEQSRLKSLNVLDAAMVMEGWYPVTAEESVSSFLDKAEAYYEMRDPVETDNVPVQLRNNGFARHFETLTKMYGTPSYNEWDPTPVVAPFFSLFFAICMGDAAYGVIITLFGMFLMSSKNAYKFPILGPMLYKSGGLVTILGVATTLVGLALGSVFGMNLKDLTPEGTPVNDYFNFVSGNFPGTKYSFQMVAAVIIGVAHLLIAMTVKAVLFSIKEGFKNQLSQWGWVLLFMGSVITGVCYMLGSVSEEMARYIIIGVGAVAAVCIYLLNNVGRMQSSVLKGILINPLAGLYDTYNMASGILGDVLSYIRLYALCLAGGALGGAFNQIGDMMPIYFGIFIYTIGHLVNLLLSAISAFVHPLRLNFVEYFKNAGYEGKGADYKPLEKTR